ncbi:uncharacterized protein LOC143806570 isoform X2 [Ranitomeya variabilis]|uniref:uncharacterized protein LOC143806570 isoform X2 n=1 Tax=Ranitomeya variabilis TaxID=490064 RepID=UPI004056E875
MTGIGGAPAYANIFLGWWEDTIVYCSDSFKRHVLHWHRFIDDVFFLWTVTFLDLKISIRDKDLVTDLYRKATATNSLLRAKGLIQDLLTSPSDRHQDGSVRFITDFNDQ